MNNLKKEHDENCRGDQYGTQEWKVATTAKSTK